MLLACFLTIVPVPSTIYLFTFLLVLSHSKPITPHSNTSQQIDQVAHRAKDFAKSLAKAGEEGARLGTHGGESTHALI